ncbi:transporter substrate-binding domain-containing protein [Stappia sp. GBMRC 2046]|uniref:Transporter substrate-binding domain-containing protein n=1 Tax=Stappia sediminis TaxID=2692190 RepID=A0A7X3S628_9HYPH|nr:transporter substrate-binding domain-containing protein [Stappia sediminis]MXN63644.1 transporter substrate-binding domain-containing protein [Stappia sediminis]
MNFMKKTTAAILGLSLLAATASTDKASAETPEEIKKRGSVNIGMLVDFPPFGIMNENNEPDGYDADVARALAEDLGVKVNLVPVTGPNRIPYLVSNQVDLLVASLGVTPERAEKVDFSDPYAGISISLYGQVDVDLSSAEKLAGHNIGVARASTQDVSITKIAPEGANIQRFDDDASAVQALLSGQVEAIGASNTVIAELEKIAPERFEEKFELRQQVQGIAVRPGSDALLEHINAFLAKQKDSGALNAIHEKWLGSPLPDFLTK